MGPPTRLLPPPPRQIAPVVSLICCALLHHNCIAACPMEHGTDHADCCTNRSAGGLKPAANQAACHKRWPELVWRGTQRHVAAAMGGGVVPLPCRTLARGPRARLVDSVAHAHDALHTWRIRAHPRRPEGADHQAAGPPPGHHLLSYTQHDDAQHDDAQHDDKLHSTHTASAATQLCSH